MKAVEFEYPLDENGMHILRTIKKYDSGLKDFVVIYYVLTEENERIALVTFDKAHGFWHRDLRYLPKNDNRRKVALPDLQMMDLFRLAMKDISENWDKYHTEFIKCKRGQI